MSWAEDTGHDMWDFEEVSPFNAPDGEGDDVWTTKDGTEIAVKHMEISHLQNAVNYLKKKHENDPHAEMWIQVFEAELKERKATQ